MSWTYQDFIDNNVERIQAFSFELKKNGKVKKTAPNFLIRRQAAEASAQENHHGRINYTNMFSKDFWREV